MCGRTAAPRRTRGISDENIHAPEVTGQRLADQVAAVFQRSQVAIPKFKRVLQPRIQKLPPLTWADVEPALYLIDTVQELREAGAKIAFVGDGSNDIEIAQLAGFSVAWGDSPQALKDASDVVVRGPNLRILLPHLLHG